MNCMKCGREIQDGQVFCPDCLEVMAAYPVNPDIHVPLPQRPARPGEKKSSRARHPAEQIRLLKKAIRWLLVTVAVLLAAIAILTALVLQNPETVPPPMPTGRNYTTLPLSDS